MAATAAAVRAILSCDGCVVCWANSAQAWRTSWAPCEMAWNRFATNTGLVRSSLCAVAWAPAFAPLYSWRLPMSPEIEDTLVSRNFRRSV